MSGTERLKYTEDDEKQLMQYYIRNLRNRHLFTNAASDDFWYKFIRDHNWTRSIASIDTHFKRISLKKIHLMSFLTAEEMFHLMSLHKYCLDKSEWTKLEEETGCKIHVDAKLQFRYAERDGKRVMFLAPKLDPKDVNPIVDLQVEEQET
ncbi:hypothetical protein M3Y94_00947700 [Aphelenchoides besseyi]|nr:hypothetical protein M3Y94_00947700 [Aphelenchoides besseyi]KAI6224839.1 hypothetical protein M3Y95_00794800 [Aphelenchoides besseyi]